MVCPGLALRWIEFAVSGFARASGEPHRKGYRGNRQQFWAWRQRAIQRQPCARGFAHITCTTRGIHHRHTESFRFKARQVAAAACNEISLAAATIGGKFESQSNNQDE
jgi:hypothetical protein